VAAGFADVKVVPSVAAGAWFALVAAPTLGFGAGLLAAGSARRAAG
jgi:hypothetical protein